VVLYDGGELDPFRKPLRRYGGGMRNSAKAFLSGYGGAGSAMFLLGTLAAVAGVVNHYPVYGGQAVRYTLAAGILFAVARFRGIGLLRPTGGEWLLLLALAGTGLVLFNVSSSTAPGMRARRPWARSSARCPSCSPWSARLRAGHVRRCESAWQR
jgi:hypothetical protein